MKTIIKSRKTLRIVKYIFLFLFMVSAGLVSFKKTTFIGVFLALFLLLLEWRLYRCPNCNKHLKGKMSFFDEKPYCPYCGNRI